ncbi:MAG: type II/IV secretion system protein, partial [Bradyrhizobium sp.]|nr:type II/IV secretion system protein [Bradyrhizobium sp.]
MSGTLSTQFQAYLRQRHPQRSGEPAGDTQLALWDRFGLSAEAFAEEAVQFTGLDRASLRELMAAPPAVSEFSDRFLREVLGYPYRSSE